MPERGPRKYDPLTRYLADLTADEVTLTFAEIEQIVGAPLPRTAWGPAFWSNGREGVFRVRPWVRAGWRVARAHLRSESPAVTFRRLPR
jgi:hypothetical protein